MSAEVALPEGSLREAWQKLGFDEAQLKRRADGTVLATARIEVADSQTLLVAEAAAVGSEVGLSDELFVPGNIIGRGGTAIVREADQLSLRRQVALKTARDVTTHGALLKEAWVGGALEHPNIVPVHALIRHEGRAAIAMRKVAGQNWAKLIADPNLHPRLRGGEPLEGHLAIFLEVLDALRFTHSRGVLHLDIKPDNVMLGQFGEVYLLDWGLAAAPPTGGPEWLQPAAELEGIAGTPGYMAPELAAGYGLGVDVRTDVYLLGATLHHVVTGAAPHAGDTVIDQLEAAFASLPATYGAEVPIGLAEIIVRATARLPSERYQSVDELRLAVVGYQARRRAEGHLADSAAQLQTIERLLTQDAGLAEVEPLFAECEVAVERARRVWPEHSDLPLHDALLARQRFRVAIARVDPDAARAALSQLPERVPELEAELHRLVERVAARERYEQGLEQIEHELDLTLGRSDRRKVFLALGAVWCVINLGYGWWTRSTGSELSYPFLLVVGLGIFAVLLPYGWLRRRVLFQNAANQKVFGALIMMAFLVQLFWLAAWVLDLPSDRAISITPIFYTYIWATLAMVLDRRLLYGAGFLALGAAITGFFPEWKHESLGISGLLAVVATVRAWK